MQRIINLIKTNELNYHHEVELVEVLREDFKCLVEFDDDDCRWIVTTPDGQKIYC